jgi:hypothetical protein
MRLDGSCHCGEVRFSVESITPYPYMRCYCSICRKTAGGGGYAINIMGRYDTLQVDGTNSMTVFRARIDGRKSSAERRFCKHCGSALWIYDEAWPELVHPFASAIDTALPVPPERVHLMLDFAPDWVQPDIRDTDDSFCGYPAESIADWHDRRGLTVTGDHER